jgi:predicted transcriptional regulator of viral defense system
LFLDTVLVVPNPLAALLEVAAPQHGLFTLEQAAAVGVGGAQVRQMAAREVLERRAHGVYRIRSVPLDERSEYMEAVLWAKGRGVIAGESALALWDLADVNPRHIHVALPPAYRPRRRGGELYKLEHVRLAPEDVDQLDGIPVVTPAVAIRQATAAGVPADLIEQAVRRAQAREHLGNQTAARLLVGLYDRPLAGTKRGVAL